MGCNGKQLLLTLCWYGALNTDYCEIFRPKERKHFISSNSINIFSTVNM